MWAFSFNEVPRVGEGDDLDTGRFQWHITHGNTCKIKRINTLLCVQQCCGLGSGGSICFWAPWIQIRIPLSEVRIRIRILLSSSKNCKKTLILIVFWLLYDFLSLKNYVNVPPKSNTQKKLEIKSFLIGVLKANDEIARSGSISKSRGSADPDPYQNVTDPQHWCPERMSNEQKNIVTATNALDCWLQLAFFRSVQTENKKYWVRISTSFLIWSWFTYIVKLVVWTEQFF